MFYYYFFFFFSSRRRHTRCSRDWSSDVCSSDLRPFARQQKAAGTAPCDLLEAGRHRLVRRGDEPCGSAPEVSERLGNHLFGVTRVNQQDRKSTRLNSSHGYISYAVFCLKKKKKKKKNTKRTTK